MCCTGMAQSQGQHTLWGNKNLFFSSSSAAFPLCVCFLAVLVCCCFAALVCCLAALKNHPLQQKLLELAPSLMKLSFFPLLSFPIPFRKLAFSPPPPSPLLLLSPPLLDPPPSSFSKALLSQNWKNRKKVVCLTFFFDPRFESTGSFSPYLHRITSQIALGLMSQMGAVGEYSQKAFCSEEPGVTKNFQTNNFFSVFPVLREEPFRKGEGAKGRGGGGGGGREREEQTRGREAFGLRFRSRNKRERPLELIFCKTSNRNCWSLLPA